MCGARLFKLAILAAVLACGGFGANAADGPIGTVERVVPEAYGTPSGAARAALGLGDPVMTDETLETTASGSLHLHLIDDSDLWLDRDSLIVLDELVFDQVANTGDYAAELGHGLFRFVTGALPHESYGLRTPTVAIGVRGTDFAVFVAPDGATRITVYAGALVLRLRSGGPSLILVPPFTATIVKANGPILASPFVWPVYPGAASVADRPLPTTFGDLSQAGRPGVDPNDPGSGQNGQNGSDGQPGGGAGGSGGSGGSSGVGP